MLVLGLTAVSLFVTLSIFVYGLKSYYLKKSVEWDGKSKSLQFDFDATTCFVVGTIVILLIFISGALYLDGQVKRESKYRHWMDYEENLKKEVRKDLIDKLEFKGLEIKDLED